MLKGLEAGMKRGFFFQRFSFSAFNSSPCPAAFDDGHFALANDGVEGFAAGTFEGDSDGAFPDGAHAFSGVAAPAFAIGVAVEDGGFDAWEVALVEDGGGCGHDFVAVIEHEGIAVGVAEEVECFNGAAGP